MQQCVTVQKHDHTIIIKTVHDDDSIADESAGATGVVLESTPTATSSDISLDVIRIHVGVPFEYRIPITHFVACCSLLCGHCLVGTLKVPNSYTCSTQGKYIVCPSRPDLTRC